ncbi:uncharacterized protein LOC128200275 [Galleria mellonella]|uniref:Uncharacterized protein LOC128200275 n=1 Tax=Galleria mellonella TaxID=7137 RepID=A0ABM3MDH1_GALME|nr:uncharacterized protein LOC128200275 [Galleria mellonella]
MSESEETELSYGHLPTSEVGCEGPDNEETGRINETQLCRSTDTSDIEVFMRVLRSVSSGLQPHSTTNLVRFDPDDPDSDIEGWCSINEVIIKHKDLKGTDLLLALTHALRGRAAACLTKLKTNSITWENIKDLLLAKFSKPMLMQDYFDRIIKFQMTNKETVADAALRLWQLIESIPKANLSDEIITGFVISVLSHIDHNIRRELCSHNITNKPQLFRILRSVSLKRRGEEVNFNYDNKRPRFNVTHTATSFYGNCHRCGEIGHKIFNCPRNGGNNSQMQKLPTPRNERRPVTCDACGKPGHIATACSATKNNEVSKKEVKLCNKRTVTGELEIRGMCYHFLFDSGSECSLIKESFARHIEGTRIHETVILIGIGNADIKCTEQLLCTAIIQGLSVEIIFYVVNDTFLVEPILLGRDIIEKGFRIEINDNGVSLFRVKHNKFCEKFSSIGRQLNTDLVDDDKESLLILLNKYSDSFIEGTPTRRVNTGVMHIDLIDPNKIVQRRPYRLSASERQIVSDKVSELLNAGVIRESSSPFASPILLVKKKDGSDRMVVDYRELNSNTRSDNYPLPRISDQIDRLHGAKHFTSLDMTSGFHCIPLEPSSIERTAFVTPDGQFEYTAMPFGLKNAPSVFQRSINKALKDCDCAQVYIDDVLIPSTSIEQGLERLNFVLNALSKAGFSLNMKKCSFLKTEITYLCYVIKSGEIRPNPNKVHALVNIPAPRTASQVRQIIGLASYFRQFIPNFSVTMAPLYPLVQHKGEINWTSEHDAVHQRVVKVLTSAPVLAIFDPDRETELHTDASSQGYGAILIQRIDKAPHVVEYFSRRTTDIESRYHSYELETLAVVRAVEHFRHYLYGRCFTVHTDCNALKSSSNKRDLTPRVHRWWAILQSYDFVIEYREGRQMSHADFLSRNPLSDKDNSSTKLPLKSKQIYVLDMQKGWLAVEQQRDSNIIDTIAKWRAGDLPNDISQSYDVRKGLLYRKIQRNKRDSDQGRCFISNEFKTFCHDNNIELHLIATGACRANGQVERVMQTLKNLLTVIENSTDSVWRDEIGKIQLVLNTTRCRVTGYTPMELMFGINQQTLGISRISNENVSEVNRSNLVDMRQNAVDNIKRLAVSDTERFNKTKAQVVPFAEGDFVFLKCCERNQTKLDSKFKGPYKVVKVLENDRYELQNIDGSNRTYKYPHESLREVPKGRAGLTEVVKIMCDEIYNKTGTVSADDIAEQSDSRYIDEDRGCVQQNNIVELELGP